VNETCDYPGVPELPDITVYVECLAGKVEGNMLQRLRLLNPFELRTATPPIASAEGCRVIGVERLWASASSSPWKASCSWCCT
jgi:hypothetical protein